jgi:hypothetical protein
MIENSAVLFIQESLSMLRPGTGPQLAEPHQRITAQSIALWENSHCCSIPLFLAEKSGIVV